MKIALFFLLYFVFVCVDLYAVTKGIVSKEYSNIALKQLALAGLIKNSSIPVTTSQPTVATGSSESYDNYSATVTSSWTITNCAVPTNVANVITGSIRCTVNSANKTQATVTWSQKYGTAAASFSVTLNHTSQFDLYSTTLNFSFPMTSCGVPSATGAAMNNFSCTPSGNSAILKWGQSYSSSSASAAFTFTAYHTYANAKFRCTRTLNSNYSLIRMSMGSYSPSSGSNYIAGVPVYNNNTVYFEWNQSYGTSPSSCNMTLEYYDRKYYYMNCTGSVAYTSGHSISWRSGSSPLTMAVAYINATQVRGTWYTYYNNPNPTMMRVTVNAFPVDFLCEGYGTYSSATTASDSASGNITTISIGSPSQSQVTNVTGARTSTGVPANETKPVSGAVKIGSQVANNTLKMPTSEVLGKVNIAMAQSCNETDLLPIGTSQVPKKCNNAMKLTYGRAVNDGTVLVDAAKNAIVDPNMQAASFPNVSEKSGAFSSKEAKRIDIKLGGTGAPYKNDRVIAENDIREACIVTGGDNEQEYSDSSKKDMCILSFVIEG